MQEESVFPGISLEALKFPALRQGTIPVLLVLGHEDYVLGKKAQSRGSYARVVVRDVLMVLVSQRKKMAISFRNQSLLPRPKLTGRSSC